MKISIIIPVYNTSAFLVKCLDSILAQTYEDFECIIVNDGSTDNSSEIIQAYCEKDKRFTVITKENGGLVSAWQAGLKQASCDYVCFLDSDDYAYPNMLEGLIEPVLRYGVDMSMGNFEYDSSLMGRGIKQHENNILPGLYQNDRISIIHRAIFPKFGHYMSPSRTCKLIKRQVMLDNLQYSDQRVKSGEDTNMMIPVTLSCRSFFYTEVSLMAYVQRPTSISHVYKTGILEGYQILIDHIVDFQKEKGIIQYKDDTENLYNFYGVLTAIYLVNSELTWKEKCRMFRSFNIDDKHKVTLKLISSKDGFTAMLYKFAVQFNIPELFFSVYKLKQKISVIKRKL